MIDDTVAAIVVQYPDAHVIYGDVDLENNVILKGELADGTYIFKYELPDGTAQEIGTFVVGGGDAPTYTNILPTLMPLDGLPENGLGYWDGYYASSVNPYYNVDEDATVTGRIPMTQGTNEVIYIKGLPWIGQYKVHSRVVIPNKGTSVQGENILTSEYFTVTEIQTNYYKLEITAAGFTFAGSSFDLILSFDQTSGDGLIIAYEPIDE